MIRVYRVCRGILAGSAFTALALFAAWHVIAFRIRCVYRWQTEQAKKGNP